MRLSNLKTRETMMGCVPHGGIGIEIGVQRGDFAHAILLHNKPSKLFLVDCWDHQPVKVYGHDPANVSQQQHEIWSDQVLARFQYERHVHVLRAYSLDIVSAFADCYFDWIYFDGNHLLLQDDIDAWWRTLKSSGWCCGHDYCEVGDYISVKRVVDSLVQKIGAELNVTQEPGFPAWAFQKP